MVALGVVLIVVGALLFLVEAHVPTGGLVGAGAILALATGAALLLVGAGTGSVVALLVVMLAGAAACAGLLVGGRRLLRYRRVRPRSGPEALVGRVGVVRNAADVFVDGALWRARPDWFEEASALHEGDRVVVERVNGLTLYVRRAEEWELTP